MNYGSSLVGLQLYPYQEDGVQWMMKREAASDKPGGLLLDDCGLGKTPQVIATLSRNPLPLTLIVVPVNLIKQWKAQLETWTPQICIAIFHGPQKPRQESVSVADYFYSLSTFCSSNSSSSSMQRRPPLVVITS